MAAIDGDLHGKRIAYSPDFGVYPVDPRVAGGCRRRRAAFEEAGATVEHVDISLPYDQLELADLWCRMIAPLNIGGSRAQGGRARSARGAPRLDAPEYLGRIEAGYD